MNYYENFTPAQAPEKISFEVLSNGDQYNISCPSLELLEETIKKIAIAFGTPPHELQEIAETIMQGDDWRFEGTFNLKLRHDILVLDNRNARGVAKATQQMKEVMDSL
jgi:hypothetical protein